MPRAEDFERVLQQHVLDVWFPRCLDREQGGYFCDYDRAWKPCGPQERLLEFQARQALFAADALVAYPDEQQWREAALHGFRYLHDVMWDTAAGGWFHLMDRAGRPLEGHTKHVHGFAYAIEACAGVFTATGETAALRLAQAAFEWIEHHAHDPDNGGYFGFLTRDGKVIRRPSEAPYTTDVDSCGTEIGLKDLNVHSDLLETFAVLYRAWPDPRVGTRLAELVDIVIEKMGNPVTGTTSFFVTPDWRPVPHLMRVGYQVQSAFRLLLAQGLAGDAGKIRPMAGLLMDRALRHAHDSSNGGYFYAVSGLSPQVIHHHDLRVKAKAWWIQAEVLKALLAVSRAIPGDERYLRAFETQWRYVETWLLDRRHGGFYSFGLDGASRWQRPLRGRLTPAWMTRKGDVWKDASHEGRALLFCMETLRATERPAPLSSLRSAPPPLSS